MAEAGQGEADRFSKILSASQSGDVDLFWASALSISGGNAKETKEEERGRTALHFGAQAGHLQLCTYLLDNQKFDVNAQDHNGDTALSLAAAAGQDETVEMLLKHGADARLYKEGHAGPLHRAAGAGSASTIRRLLRAGADVNATSESGPPLFWAAGSGHADAVVALLRAGADPNLQSHQGMTPLAMAAAVGSLDVVRALLAGGAQVDAVVQGGFTALHIAAESGNTALVEMLLKAGAKPDVRDDQGKTPLRLAAETGHRGVISLLARSALGTGGDEGGVMDSGEEGSGGEFEEEEEEEEGESEGEEGIGEEDEEGLGDQEEGGSDEEGGEGEGGGQGRRQQQQQRQHSAVAAGPSAAPAAGAAPSAAQHSAADGAAPGEPEGTNEGVAEMFRQKANEFFLAGDFKGAVQLYSLAIQHCTRSPLLWGNRSAAHLKLGDAELAMQDARAARTLDPSYAKGWYREGLAAAELGRWDDAVSAYTVLNRLRPGNDDVSKLLQDAQERAAQQA